MRAGHYGCRTTSGMTEEGQMLRRQEPFLTLMPGDQVSKQQVGFDYFTNPTYAYIPLNCTSVK